MKRFTLLPVLLFLLNSSLAQESAADLGVAAIGLVVSDIEASEKFYTEILLRKVANDYNIKLMIDDNE